MNRKGHRRLVKCAGGMYVLAFLLTTALASGQQRDSSARFVQLTAGLGVNAHWDPSLNDYFNALAIPSTDQKLTGFTSASEFFVCPEVQVAEEWSVGYEYSYFLKSYSAFGSYPWDFDYTTQLSTIIVHYLVPGDGYWLKCGGGIGYATGGLTERYLESGAQQSYRTSGSTFKLEAVGNTEFDPHFWGSIGVDLRWVYAGSFHVGATRSASTPKLDFFNAGVKFGVTCAL